MSIKPDRWIKKMVPPWESYVTLETSNTTPLPAKIYAYEGIAQVLFFESDEECKTSYADKKGKYRAPKGVTLREIRFSKGKLDPDQPLVI